FFAQGMAFSKRKQFLISKLNGDVFFLLEIKTNDAQFQVNFGHFSRARALLIKHRTHIKVQPGLDLSQRIRELFRRFAVIARGVAKKRVERGERRKNMQYSVTKIIAK